MKVVFLDIDGVMTSNSLNEEINKSTSVYTFSKGCVNALNKILESHRSKIVLTSSWRTVFDVEKQCEIFSENGVVQMPYSQTIDLGYENRSEEIRQYISKQKNISNFLILDDMEIIGFDDNFIRVDFNTGLTMEHIGKAIKILNQDFTK